MRNTISMSMKDIRKLFHTAALNAAMAIFFLAIGLNNAMIHAIRLTSHGNDVVYSSFPYEVLLDFAWFFLSALCAYFAVYRFGKACMAIAESNNSN